MANPRLSKLRGVVSGRASAPSIGTLFRRGTLVPETECLIEDLRGGHYSIAGLAAPVTVWGHAEMLAAAERALLPRAELIIDEATHSV
jgi:hypothetical protein